MRIVALVPGATEWIAAFGMADQLWGRSHECDFPPVIQDVPVLTSSPIASKDSSAEIDEQVQTHLSEGLSMYSVDTDRLKELSPDLIVTQTQCDVCAVSEEQLASALNILSAGTTELFSFSPATFKDVLDQALALGVKLEQTEAAMEFLSQKEHDLHRLKQALRRCAPPTVLAIEWMEPVMVAGHWTPDLITHAGGVPLLTASGEASRYISWEAVSDADPDVICLIPCGFDLGQIRGNIDQLIDHPEWQDLRAVQNGDVYAFNGDAYFNRPGPRLYRSIELLALALHRDHVRDLVSSPSSNEMARIHSRSFSTN